MHQQIFKFIILLFVLACFALSPVALAVSPAPDGGYAGNNTAEGTQALQSLVSGGVDITVLIWSIELSTAVSAALICVASRSTGCSVPRGKRSFPLRASCINNGSSAACAIRLQSFLALKSLNSELY